MIQPIDVLNHLRANGWTQGEYGPECGPNCIRGAQIAVQSEMILNHDLQEGDLDRITMGSSKFRDLVLDVIAEQFPERARSIPGFNDHPQTSFEDVEMVLEKAQLRLDERV